MEGKSLSGPQSTGLLPGRKDLIKAFAENGTPFATAGRLRRSFLPGLSTGGV